MRLHRDARRSAMLLLFAALALLLLAAAPAAAPADPAADLVTQVSLTPATPNIILDNGTMASDGPMVSLGFTYQTAAAGGVYIWARPFTDGALTPNYGAHGSDLYPVGSGTGTGFFFISSGDVTVDQIRFQMKSGGTLLSETFLPVHYQFVSATTDVVSGLTMTPTPNVLKFKQKVSVKFNYTTARSAGVRVAVRPLSGTATTRNSVASAAALCPSGSGTGSQWFTVAKGATTVTAIRVTVWNASKTKVLFRTDLPVSYRFKSPANIVNSIKLTPASPNFLPLGTNVDLTFKYTTNEAKGVRIFARPFTNGSLTPNYGAHGSDVYPVGSGSGTGYFTITSGAATVDQIRLQMYNAAQTKLLFSTKIPVWYQFD